MAVSVPADPGGDGGWINLPGGGQGNAGINGGGLPRLRAVRPLSMDLKLRLDVSMQPAAILSSGSVVGATQGTLVVPSVALRSAAAGGMQSVRLQFVNAAGQVLDVNLVLDPVNQQITVEVY